MRPETLGVFIPIIAIIFSLSIPIIAIIVDHLTKKAKMRVMEKAIEKGASLEGLSLADKKAPRAPYRSGMVCLAVGVGIAIASFFIKEKELIAISVIPALIGIVLIINDRLNYDRLFNKEPDQR